MWIVRLALRRTYTFVTRGQVQTIPHSNEEERS
jgi:hypothetical protein